ncbi:MAG TPA: YIP1 family protein [Candidatus Nanoarchaeia archaeon]|nr:YIP1 family protein [Candidatus Nanoarchaeia archaeon]
MNILERLKAVIVSPSKLFNDIKKEDYKPTLIYYLVVVLGLGIFSSLITYATGKAQVELGNLVISWITSIISMFIMAFFIGLVASWFGGDRSWVQGLKAIVYPASIFAIFGVLMAIAIAVVPSLANLDFQDPQQIMANLGALVGAAVGFGLIALALLVWVIILYVKGISISSKLSVGKAIGTLIIAGLLAAIVSGMLSWILLKIGLLKPVINAGLK